MFEKRKIIKDLRSLSSDDLTQFKKCYPRGFRHSMISYTDKNGKRFWLVPLETEGISYLLRIPISKLKVGLEDEEDAFDSHDDTDDQEEGAFENINWDGFSSDEQDDDLE